MTTYPYNGATQGGILELVPSPDEHLYTFFGGGSEGFVFARLDYQGAPTTIYTLSSGQGIPYAFFLGMSGDFYGLSELNPEGGGPAGIFRLTPSGTFSWIIPTMPLPGRLDSACRSWRRPTATSTAPRPGAAARTPAQSM